MPTSERISRCLLVTKEFSATPDSGGTLRTLALLEQLATRYQTTVISPDGVFSAAPGEALRELPALAGTNAPGGMPARLRTATRYRSISGVRTAGARLLANLRLAEGRYDVGVIDHTVLAGLADDVAVGCDQLVVSMHNIESDLMAQRTAAAGSWVQKLMMRAETHLLRRLEAQVAARYPVVVCTEADARALPARYPPIVCRNGIFTHLRDGDPTNGDPTNGDPTNGDPANGDPANGDPANGDPTNGDPTNADPANGDPAGGDIVGGDITGGNITGGNIADGDAGDGDADRARPAPFSMVFSGALDWGPNVEGLLWFLALVWPALRRQVPQVTLTIAGRNPARPVIEAARAAGVTLRANPPVMATVLARHMLGVVPLLSGGGSRIKILEYLAAGLNVVSTDVGASGLEDIPGALLDRLPGDPAAFAAGLAARLAAPVESALSAPDWVRKHYAWEVTLQPLLDHLQRNA